MPHVIRDGQRVAFEALGSGPDTVLLVHNLLSWRGSFGAVADLLAPRCRVLMVDLRGHGESGGTTAPFTAQTLADQRGGGEEVFPKVYSAAPAGDFNGDGKRDFFLGESGATTARGSLSQKPTCL